MEMRQTVARTDELPGNSTVITPSSYTQESWSSTTSPYSQSPYGNSPMSDYAHFGGYIPHGMPSEQPLPALPSSISHQQQHHHRILQAGPPMTHQQLPSLNTAWPSELIQHSQTNGYSMPHNTIAAPVPVPVTTEPLKTVTEKQRRTLSFEQKRAMCQYHEDNPKLRQADIGTMFGVERSTVSKVLRNKELFLKGETDKDNAKRSAGKNPDFDRTLSNYVRRQRERGIAMTDSDIMEQAQRFARGSDNRQAILNNLTPNWLNRFKQRYSLGMPGPLRRASESNIPEHLSMSARLYSISPSSPSADTSPLSGCRSDDDLRARGDCEFVYRPFASHSEASLTDNAASSFSSDFNSPAGQFGFSQDGPAAGFPLDPNFGYERKRETTVPSLNLQYTEHQQNEGNLMTPRNLPSSTAAAPCKQESPVVVAMPTLPTLPTLRRNGNKSIVSSKMTGINVEDEAPTMEISEEGPSPEDAQRAAATLLNYLQNLDQSGQFDREYSTIMKLTKKLQIQSNQFSHNTTATTGLTRIPEGDMELITAGGDQKN